MAVTAQQTARAVALAAACLFQSANAQHQGVSRPADRNTAAAAATHTPRASLEPLRAWQFVAEGNAAYVGRLAAARLRRSGPILERRLHGQPAPTRAKEHAPRPVRPAGAGRYVCAVLVCADMDVDVTVTLGLQRQDVLLLRAPGPFASPEATAMLERAVRRDRLSLVVVLGHAACDVLRPAPGTNDALSRRVAALRKQPGGRQRPLHEQLLHRQREQLMRGSKILSEAVDDQRLAIVPATFDATTGAVRSIAPRAQLLPVAPVK